MPPLAANAALAAYVRAGNLRAAAGVVSHMGTTQTALRREGLEALLWYASVRCGDGPTSLRVFEALRRHAEAEAEAEEPKRGRRRGKAGEEEESDEEEEESSFGGPATPPAAPATPVCLGATPLLLVLPHLPPAERAPFCVSALRDGLLRCATSSSLLLSSTSPLLHLSSALLCSPPLTPPPSCSLLSSLLCSAARTR